MNSFPTTASILSEKDLCQFIKDRYDLQGEYSCKLFRTGVNHTYFISSSKKKFVLRVYCHNWRTKIEIEQELALLNLLKEHSLSVSYPVADTQGNLIQQIQAPEGLRYAVVFSFAEGQKMRFMSNQTCFSIGSLMAKIHCITEGRKIERTDYTSETLLYRSYDLIRSFFSEEVDEMKFLKNISHKISTRFEESDLTEYQNGIVHLDIWYDNLSVNREDMITIFDFDNCGNGPLILDVGYFCKQLFFIEADKEEYESKVKSFLDGYLHVRSLSDNELQLISESGAAIFVFYLGLQAKRFDWSNIFYTENYLKMFVGRIKAWMDYHENKIVTDNL